MLDKCDDFIRTTFFTNFMWFIFSETYQKIPIDGHLTFFKVLPLTH